MCFSQLNIHLSLIEISFIIDTDSATDLNLPIQVVFFWSKILTFLLAKTVQSPICELLHDSIILYPRLGQLLQVDFTIIPLLTSGRYLVLLLRVMDALLAVGKLTCVAKKKNTFWMPLFLMDCTKIRLSSMGSWKKIMMSHLYKGIQ